MKRKQLRRILEAFCTQNDKSLTIQNCKLKKDFYELEFNDKKNQVF